MDWTATLCIWYLCLLPLADCLVIGHFPSHWTDSCASRFHAQWGGIPTRFLGLADPVTHLEKHGAALGRSLSSVIAIIPPGFQKVDVARECRWEGTVGHGWLCSLHLQSPATLRHILVFSKLHMAQGAQLVVYSPERSKNCTLCEEDCMVFGPEDAPSGRLMIPDLQGDVVAIEYYQPLSPHDGDFPVLYLESVMQGIGEGGLRAAAEREMSRRRRRLSYWQVGTQFDMVTTAMTFSTVGACTPLIGCEPAWNATQSRAVVAIYVVHPETDTVVICSGAIINTPGQQGAFLLTADHCFANKTNINNFGNWVVAFNYKVPGCNKTSKRPPMTEVVQGVRIKFYSSRSDILLLEVTGALADRFKPFALGYDARADYVPKRVVGIHHPGGDVMHISTADGPGKIRTNFTAWKFPDEETQPTDATHFEIAWTRGVTAGGSSGSPLIDADTGLVVGVLTGGPSSCTALRNGTARDYYGRLSRAWGEGLHRFLSNDPPEDMTESDGIMLNSMNQGALIVDMQTGRDIAPHGPGFNYFPNHFSLSMLERTSNITYYLTDPPAKGETITADIRFHGMTPGNQVSAQDYLAWDIGPSTFTLDTYHAFPRVFQVWLQSNVSQIPGGIMRFIFTVRLTSSSNSSYMQVTTIGGVIEEKQNPWWAYKPYACPSMPCNFTREEDSENKRAVITTQTGNLSALSMTLQLIPGAMPTVMLAAYCDGIIQWADSPAHLMYASDVVTMTDIRVPMNSSCALIISDYHNMDAVLPVSIIYGGHAQAMPGGPRLDMPAGPVDAMLAGGILAPQTEATVIPLRWRPSPPLAPDGSPVPFP